MKKATWRKAWRLKWTLHNASHWSKSNYRIAIEVEPLPSLLSSGSIFLDCMFHEIDCCRIQLFATTYCNWCQLWVAMLVVCVNSYQRLLYAGFFPWINVSWTGTHSCVGANLSRSLLSHCSSVVNDKRSRTFMTTSGMKTFRVTPTTDNSTISKVHCKK